jgi:nitrate reductase NapE component
MIDRFAQTSTWRARFRWLFLAQALLILPLAAIPYVNSFPITMAMFSLAMFVAPGPTVGAIAYAGKHYSTSQSGLIAGLCSGAWSAVVALQAARRSQRHCVQYLISTRGRLGVMVAPLRGDV